MIYIVRGLAWYPRKGSLVKRPNTYDSFSDAEKAQANGLGRVGVIVKADSKEEAVSLVKNRKTFERVDGLVTKKSL